MKRFFTLCFFTALLPLLSLAKNDPPAGTITPSGSLSVLSTTYGTPSSESSFSFTATGLGASEIVTITAPAGFEVSLTSGSGFSNSVNKTADGTGAIASTNVFVRLSGTAAANTYSGNVTLAGSTANANVPTVASTISKKALTMSGLSVPASKIYDGTTAAVVSGSATLQASEAFGSGNSADGKPYTGDVVNITGTATGTYDNKDVATASSVTFGGLTLGGAQAGNYSLTIQSPASATITAKALTMTGLSVPASKIYDGTTAAVVSGTATLQSSEAVGAGNTSDGKPYTGDVVNITGTATGTYDSKDVATASSVTFGGLSLSGAQAGNYSLTIQSSASATITAKALTMTGLSVPASKIYDGTTAAVVSGTATLQSSEAVGAGNTSDGKPYTGDVVNITGTATGTYNSKDVATASSVTFGGLSLGGAQGGNYSLTIQSSASATITAKALTMTGLSVPASKIYDGTTTAVVSGTAALQSSEAAGAGNTSDGKPYTGDVVNITGTATGTYNNKNVATASTVTFAGLNLGGADAGNYSLTIQSAASATITAKALTMSGLSVPASKIYNGTTAAVVSGTAALQASEAVGAGTTADGKPYTGDVVSITGTATGTYNTKDVSTATTVTYGGLSLTGAEATNYSLTIQAAASATITAKALTMSGLSVPASKVYDGNTTATVSGTPALQASEAAGTGTTADGKPYTGDVVSISGSATGTYNSKDVLTATTVTYGGLSLAGAQSSNYSLTIQSSASATITAKALTVSGITANNKVYDGTTTASLTGTGTLNGIVGADVVNLTGSPTATFTSAATSAGATNVSVNVTGYTLGGAQAANYSVTLPVVLTATIYASEPTNQVKNISFSAVTAVSMTINWTNGNGANRLVLVNEGASVSATPTDFSSYTASTDWTAKGSQIGSGNYVVYAGNGNSVSLSNLNGGTTYFVQVFEFNGTVGSGLENYNINTDTNNPKSQITNNYDVTSTFTAGSGSATISSIVNTSGAEVAAFTFTANDLGTADGTSTRFTQLIFRPGTGNQISDWTQLIAGAELYDNAGHGPADHGTAVITANTITIPSISAGGTGPTPSDLGTIANGTSRNYTLKIWLKSSLGGSLPTTVDGQRLVFSITGSDVTPVSQKSAFAPATTTNSGSSNDQIAVVATKININQQPSTSAFAGVALSTQPIFEATDANNNRDLDINNALNVGTSNGSTNPASAPTNFASGLADFTASGFKFNGIGTTTMNVSITSPSLTSPNSNSITVTSSTNQGPSVLTMSPSPLIAGTTGSISGGVGTNVVLGFSIQTSGAATTLTDLTFLSSPSVTGLVKNFQLYSNSSDSFTGATQVATSSSLVFSGMSIPVSSAITYFYLVCDVEPYFSTASPAIVFQLPAGNFTVASGGAKTGSGQTSTVYTLQDNTPPDIQSITTLSPVNAWSTTKGTSATSVQFQVVFTEPVTGVSPSDFKVVYDGTVLTVPANGISGLSSVSSTTYNITVSNITGLGHLRIDLIDDNTIQDNVGNLFKGPGLTDYVTDFTNPSWYYSIVLPAPSAAVSGFSVNQTYEYGQYVQINNNISAVQPPTNYLVMAREKLGSTSFPTVADGTPVADDINDGSNDGSNYFLFNGDGVYIQNIAYNGPTTTTEFVFFLTLKAGVAYDFIVYPYTKKSIYYSDDNIDYGTPTTFTATIPVATNGSVTSTPVATSIPSTITASPGQNVFTFKVTDGTGTSYNGSTLGYEYAPTKFSGLTIRELVGTDNVSDWSAILAGAELYDINAPATKIAASSITSNQIIFTSIPSINSGDLGFVDPSTVYFSGVANSKTYGLRVYFKSTSGALTGLDDRILAFTVSNTDFAYYNGAGTAADHQASSTLTSGSTASSGANTITVTATKLVFTTDVQSQIGVATPFSSSASPHPTVKAYDANDNLDVDYANSANITNTAGLTQSVASMNFSAGVLDLGTFYFTSSGGPTNLSVSGTGTPVVSSVNSTNSITTVISNLTKITSGTASPALIPSTATTAASAVQVLEFTITEDFGADNTNYTNNDGLPTQIKQILIKQGSNNNATYLNQWDQVIQGAQLKELNGGTTVSAIINSNSLQFDFTAGSTMSLIPDGNPLVKSNTYQLRVWLKTPMPSTTLQDNIDNKFFDFLVDETSITLYTPTNSTSTFQAGGTSSGVGKNKVNVDAKRIDFTTQWTVNALQSYDAALSPTPIAKARDVNGNLDQDWNTAATVTTASPVTYPLANFAVTVTNGVITFNSGLQVTSGGGGLNNGSTNLIVSSTGLTSGSSNVFILNYSGNSDVVRNTGFTHPTNINYASAGNQVTDITSGTGTTIEQFTVRDGGGASDTDGTSTVVDGMTFTLQNAAYLRKIALYNNSGNEVAELDVQTSLVGSDISFTGLSTAINKIIANDNTNIDFTVKVSFLSSNIIDNAVININLKSVVAAGVSSSFVGGTSTTMPSLSAPTNAIAVVATQLDITTPSAASFPSLSTDFPGSGGNIVVKARDIFANVDTDFNGKITALTNATNATMINGPTLGTSAFSSGIYNFATNFQFTTGNDLDDVKLNIKADNTGGNSGTTCGTNAICSGISPALTLKTSFESSLVGDPTFTAFASPPAISYVNYQENSNIQNTSTSYELLRALLVDGSRGSSYIYNNGSTTAPLNTNTDSGDGVADGDSDGANTTLTSITIRIYKPSTLRRIALYSNGVEIPGTELDATTYNNGSGLINSATTYYDFTWSQATGTASNPVLLTAPDDGQVPLSVRVSFRNTSPELNDQDVIKVDLVAASLGTGSKFFNGPAIPANPGPYIGGQTHNGGPGTVGTIDVIATSLDFTTQPSTYAGINEPVGPTYTSSPLPSTSAGIVTARDKFTLVDLDFNYAASNISISDPAGDNIASPASFLNGVLNLDGMRYGLTGDGTLKVVAGGIDSNNPPGANTQAKVCNPVNVVNVTATYNGVGVLGNGTPAPATAPVSIKGGSLSQVIFGVTFTAQGATASEPTLKKFSISFDIPFSTPSRTIFSNFVVKEGSVDITSPSINGNLVISSSKGNSNLDSITVDLSAIPRSLFSAPGQSLTYYLIADVDATANISTPSITPYFSDGGYLSTSDDNIVVSQGTASGSFAGNVYSFASTKPPVLITAKNTLNPAKTSSPYNGQLNVSSSLSQIKLVFDTKVVSLDGGLNGGAELWNRNTNTKVADLVADPGSGNYLSTSDYTDVINPLTLNINFLSGNSFQPDEVYYVLIKKGDFDPLAQPPAGHGISDQGLNFYGGISSNSTLYFKIASDQPLKLTAAKASIYNSSVGSLSSKFDQFGTAYFLVLPTGSPAPASYSEVKSPATYSSPTLIRASGSYAITQVNVLQTHTFSASNPSLNPFVLGQTYDVYLYAENDNPVPVSSGGIYGTSLVANAGGPTLKTKFTATSYQPNYLICSNSFVTVTEPIILGESSVSSFSSGTLASPNTQDFNILLPSGYQFDLTTLPDVQLVGTDFNSTSATVTFVSNSVMKVSYKNFGSASLDYIVISNMRLTGVAGSAAQNIYRFYGNNTSFSSPTASLGTIGLTPNATYTFTNSYSNDNTFPSGAPSIVNAIPDNYIDLDPNIKGSIRLIPNISVANDYNASIFSGTGVTNDLLALSAVQNNSAFNITMNHTDPNGCISEISQQYLVYDHNSPISKKLGGANSSVNLPGTAQALINPNFPNPAPASPSAQTIFNNELAGYELVSLSSNIPAAVVKNQVSQIISGSDWQLQVSKIPETPTPVVVGSIGTYYDYKWDYSHILNPLNESGANPGGTIQIDPYYGDLNHRFDAVTGNKNTYWKGGSLGNVEFTGLFRSTADLSVYVPFRQNVELFVPAVPLIEIASSNRSSYDASDATQNTISNQTAFNYINNRFGFQYTSSSGYQGTAIFCESGGVITLNGFPAALGGVSTGNFGVYDFQSYDFNEFVLKAGTITTLTSSANVTGVGTSFTTELSVGARISDANGNFIGTVLTITDNLHLTLSASAAISVVAASYKANLNQPIVTSAPNTSFVDNGNGTMTLDPSQIKNGYNDILITYTYQDNNSPAIGTGYLVIRVTPNPQPKFTIASLQAATGSPGSSSVTSFCSGSQITLDASISSIATSSQGTTNSIQKYAWDFGDPNSGPNNSSIVASATHTYTISSTYTVNLSLTSNWNCPSLPLTVTGSPMPSFVEYDGSTGTIKIGEIPAVDFSFLGNCVTDLITFTDLSSTANGANSTISKFDWNFGDNSTFTGYNQVLLPSSPDGRNVSHTYTVPNFYHVTLTTTTDLGCQRTVIKDITQLPLQTFTLNGAYNEFFDSNNGGWQALNVDNSQSPSPFVGSTSWTYSGGKWTIPATYLKNEKSALYSACLDLSSIPRPVLQFNAYVNLPSGDGLVVQYSKDSKNVQDGTKVWEVLGSTPTGPSPGLDWYNTSGLPSNPGTGYTNSKNSSGYGWSSNLNYVQPKHKLEDVTSAVGNPNSRIILRFAFSSLSDGATGNGITIDSVRVGSRTRTILFENFTTTDVGTNTNLPSVIKAEMNAIAAFTQANISSTQLVNLNYHVGFVGQNDPFNLDNPADPSARALYYNVTQVPYAFLDGVHSRSSSGSDLFKDWGQGAYDLQTLQLARANFLDTNPTTVTLPSDGSVAVNVHFTPLIDLPYGINKGTILGVAFLEKQITSTPSYGKVNTGETSFNYVLKKMLPSAGGTKFTQPLTANASVDAGTFKWIPQNLHSNKLTVVVFLQNELTKEVYQAELFDDIPAPGPVTAIEPLTEELVKVYPNPSDKEFTVELPQAVTERTSILMTDQLGRSIETGAFNEGEQSKTISTQGLSDGMYILQIGDKSNAVRKKIMVVHN